MARPLLVAIPNRHITHVVLELLSEAGWTWNALARRQLSFVTHDGSLHVFMVKTHDIPQIIMNEFFDLGFVQASVLREEGCPLTVVSNLPIAQGRMVVGVPKGALVESPKDLHGKRLVTRNPRLARLFLEKNQIECPIMVVSGSPEAYVSAGASDAVLAYWKTGQTFRDNGLRVVAEVCRSNLQLVASAGNAACKEVIAVTSRIDGCLKKRTLPEKWIIA